MFVLKMMETFDFRIYFIKRKSYILKSLTYLAYQVRDLTMHNAYPKTDSDAITMPVMGVLTNMPYCFEKRQVILC